MLTLIGAVLGAIFGGFGGLLIGGLIGPPDKICKEAEACYRTDAT